MVRGGGYRREGNEQEEDVEEGEEEEEEGRITLRCAAAVMAWMSKTCPV